MYLQLIDRSEVPEMRVDSSHDHDYHVVPRPSIDTGNLNTISVLFLITLPQELEEIVFCTFQWYRSLRASVVLIRQD